MRDAAVTDAVRTTDGLALVGETNEVAGAPESQDAKPHRYSPEGLRALARAVRDMKETG